MKLKFCLSTVCMLLALMLSGQELNKTWSKQISSDGKNDIIHAITQSVNGNLLAVGETYLTKEEHNGLLLVLHPETGESLRRIEFGTGNKKDDIFYDLIQTGDGGFYAVGTSVVKGIEEASIWRLDENGVLIESASLGMGSIHNAVLLEDNSIALFSKIQAEDGTVKIIKYSRKKVQKELIIGNGGYGDIVGGGLSYDNHIIICGNTIKSANSQRGDIWVAKLDENLNLIAQKTIGDKAYDKVWYASTTFDGYFLLVGQTGGTYEDAQIIELDANLSIKLEEIFEGNLGEYASGAIRTFDGQYVVVQSFIATSFNEAILLRGLKPFSKIGLSEGNLPFEVRDVYYGFGGKYLIGGIAKGDKQLLNARIECLENGSLIVAAKSLHEIEIIDSPRLEDEDGDGLLSPNERAAIVFKIKNVGSTPLTNTKVKVLPKNLIGINYFEEVYISYLQINGEKKISIPFNGLAALKGGNLDATLQFFEGNQKFKELDISFRSKKGTDESPSLPTIKHEIIIDWGEDLKIGANREIRSTEPIIDLPIQTYYNRPIVEKDTKTYANGTILEDQKALKELIDTVKVKGNYRSRIRIQVPLQEGRNVVYVKIEKDGISESSDSLIIYYEPRLPNLHVLAIGVSHTDLRYTSKDAQEFAALISQQGGLGIYNEVFVTELTTPEETTSQRIKINFEKLYSLYAESEGRNKIESKDVLVVFISSHGKILSGDFVIIPSDYSSDVELSTTVNYKKDIISFLDKIKCKKLVLIDACHSGAASSKISVNTNVSMILNELNASSPGHISISSCSNKELSFEDKTWENGAFTEALLEALKNQVVTLSDGTTIQCDKSTDKMVGVLSIEEIFNFLQTRVPDLVKQKFGLSYLQTPTMPDVKGIDKSLNIFMLPK